MLPVYRVDFYRHDNIRLYVETSTGKLAAAVDDTKAWFSTFFSITHSWSFLDGAGAIKNILLGSVSLLCFFSSLLGFYVYQVINKKKTNVQKSKKIHRTLGNVFVLTTMLYALSGAWHSFHKTGKEPGQNFSLQQQFALNEIGLVLPAIFKKLSKDEKLSNISIVKLDDKNYWQASTTKTGKKLKWYFEINSLKELPAGDMEYGRYLACCFAEKKPQDILSSRLITSFNHEYSMMNKRLPVVAVNFSGNKNYYVETSTGKLSAIIKASDKAERFSFSNLHMHHYWEMWLGKEKGKPFKNAVLMATTLGLLLLAVTGLIIYHKKRK